MNKRALIVCDLDGTLMQADLITIPAVQRTFARYGLPEPAADDIAAFFGSPVEEYHAWLATLCQGQAVGELIAAVDACELQLIASEGELYPGTEETLAMLLAAGHELAMASNAPADYFEEALRAHGLTEYFDLAVCRGYGFSNKRAMLAHVYEMRDMRPVIMLGDRQDDVDSVHALGGLAVGATYGFGRKGELERADAVVREIGDVPAAVNRLLDERASTE